MKTYYITIDEWSGDSLRVPDWLELQSRVRNAYINY